MFTSHQINLARKSEMIPIEHTEARRCIYARMNWVNIGSGNGMVPVWC